MNNKIRKTKGMSLVEALVALAIFALFGATMGMLGSSGSEFSRIGVDRSEALLLAEEGLEAARAIRSENVALLVPGTHGVSVQGGKWVFSGALNTIGPMTRTVTITLLAPGRTLAESDVIWDIAPGRTGTIHLSTFLHSIFGTFWTQSSEADFSAGGHHGTLVLQSGDGGVGLTLAGEWAGSEGFLTHDIAGSATVQGMMERGGILYAVSQNASGGDDLILVDLSDVTGGSMPRLSNISIGANVYDIALSDTHAFLATDGDELIVVRLSDLTIVNTVNLSGGANGIAVAVEGDVLYLGRESSTQPELYRMSIANPEGAVSTTHSAQIGGNVNDITLANGFVFVGNGSGTEILVYDQAALSAVGGMNLSGESDIYTLTVFGQTLYAGRQSSGEPELLAIDISNPSSGLPILASTHVTGSVRGITVGNDNRIYASSDNALSELAVFASGTLAPISTLDVNGNGSRSIVFHSPYVYLGLSGSSPEIVAIRGGVGAWNTPLLLGEYNTPGSTDGLSVTHAGGYAYVGTGNSSGNEFFVFDLTNPPSPQLVGSMEVGGHVNDIAIVGTRAYLASSHNSQELVVVNIANPSSPSVIGAFNAPGTADGLTVTASGNTVYLGTENNSGSGREIYVLDVTNPGSIIQRSTSEVSAHVRSLALSGTWLLGATENNARELIILDVSNPSAITEVASYNTQGDSNGLSVTANGQTVYLGTQNNGLGSDFFIFSISPVGNPTLLSFLDLGGDHRDIALLGNLALLATTRNGGGLSVLDISNSGSPLLVSDWSAGATGNAAATDGQYAFLASAADLREFAIIGPSGVPTERAHEGWFTSQPFDSGAAGTNWGDITWSANPAGVARLQIRTAGTQAGLSLARWLGAGGVMNGEFVATGTPITIDPQASGTQWIQFRARLIGDGVIQPILEDVLISYQ